MNTQSPAGKSNDATEAMQALEDAAKIIAKMIVKAIGKELETYEKMPGTITSRIGTISQHSGESNAQGKSLVFSVRVAAKLMGISKNTVYTLVQTGEIPSIKWGKRILIPRVALEKMLEEAATTRQNR